MPTDDVHQLRLDLQLMLRAMGTQVSTLDRAAALTVVDGINRMWTLASERSDAEARALDRWTRPPDEVWEKLPDSAQLKAVRLQQLLESDDFHSLIPGLFDICWEMWVKLEFNSGTTAALELLLMLEDLAPQWRRVPKRERTRLSHALHMIQVRLDERLQAQGADPHVANGRSPVWKQATARMIELCRDPEHQADVMAFSEAFVATRELYVRMGLYAAPAVV